jgi:hypothetical protein
MNNGYKCQYCSKIYREKFNYDRHYLCCEFFHKSSRERNNEIDISNEQLPSQRDMYLLIQDMVLRIDKLEKENARYRKIQNKKINLLDWLNKESSEKPIITFSNWIYNNLFPHIKDNLEIVFNIDLLKGIVLSFDKAIEKNDEKLPICAVDNDNKTMNLYIFEKPSLFKHPNQEFDSEKELPRWVKLSNAEFDKFLIKIDHQFLVDFNRHWYCVNKNKMETDESFKDKYIHYHKAILGGDRMSDETRYNKIRHYLYEKIKQRINSVSEIEVN